jgi:hypothetical protein
MTGILEWRQSLHLEGRQWFQRFDNMFAVLQSCANSRRLSPHRDDWKIEQNLIDLETTQEYMAGTGVKRYCTKLLRTFGRSWIGKAKPLSNEVLMVPNVMYMLHAWIGLESMETQWRISSGLWN